MTGCWKSLYAKFTRKKAYDDDGGRGLKTALSTFDLTMLGIGSSIGLGMYVLAGIVARTVTGPAVIISFLIAAFASVLAGMCFAEFGARVPNAGSAYAYSYVACGEIVAFVVGWNLIIEYAIGVASVARAYSVVFDTLVDHRMIEGFKSCCSLNVSFLAEYFDWFAFLAAECVAVLLTLGVKESAMFNNVFTVLNLAVVLFVIFMGSAFANTNNWRIDKREALLEFNGTITAEQIGEGGFAPFGFHGIMKGAAICFYGLVGFDSIAATAEEARNPQKSVPLAIIFSISLVLLAYLGTATVLTMMVPYYLQDLEAPLAEAFAKVGFPIGKWVVTIGALCGHSASLVDAMFPMPRVIYAMADDGVIFKFMSKIHSRFKTPVIATMICGTFGGLMAALFELGVLIDMMSIGTLSAYTIVAICVLCLRYGVVKDKPNDKEHFENDVIATGPPIALVSCKNFVGQIFNKEKFTEPNGLSSFYANAALFTFCVTSILFISSIIFGVESSGQNNTWVIMLIIFLGLLILLILISLSKQPVSPVALSFKVPLVPWIPGLSILFNLYLMMALQWATWIRFGIWMIVGFVIYGICLCNGTTDAAYQKVRPKIVPLKPSKEIENCMEVGDIADSGSSNTFNVAIMEDSELDFAL